MRSWLSRVSLFRASAAAVQKAMREMAPEALPEAPPAMAETLEQRRLFAAAAGGETSVPQAALATVMTTTSVADVAGTYEGTFTVRRDGKKQSIGFTLNITQSGHKLTGTVRAGPLTVNFVGVVRKNQFKLALDGSPAAGFAVGRVGRNGEKLGGVITISDLGRLYVGKFSAVEGAAPRVIIGGSNTGGAVAPGAGTGGGTANPGTTPPPATGTGGGGGGAVVDPGEGLPPGFPDGPPAEQPPPPPAPGEDPGQLPPTDSDPIDSPTDPGTGGGGGGETPAPTQPGRAPRRITFVGEPGTTVGNNWGIVGRHTGVFEGQVSKINPQAPNNPNFRTGTDDRNTVFRVITQTVDGAISGTIQVDGVGTYNWTGFINGRVFDFVLANGAGTGNGRVSDSRRGMAGDLLVEVGGYRAKGHYAVQWDGIIVDPGPGPGPGPGGVPGWDVNESNAEDGILIGDLQTALDLADDGDIQNQTGNDPDPDDEDDFENYIVQTLEYPPELFRTFDAGADNIVIDALGIADVVAPSGSGMFTLGVTADDGFAIFVNDVQVLAAPGPAAARTVTTPTPVQIEDGDEIRVIYFENFGSDGELNVFIRTATGDVALGDPTGEVLITVPGTTPPPPPPPPPGGPPPPPPPPPVGPPAVPDPLASYPGGVVPQPYEDPLFPGLFPDIFYGEVFGGGLVPVDRSGPRFPFFDLPGVLPPVVRVPPPVPIG